MAFRLKLGNFLLIPTSLDLLIMSFSGLSVLFLLYFCKPIGNYRDIPLLFSNLFNVPIISFYVPPISLCIRSFVSLDCSIA